LGLCDHPGCDTYATTYFQNYKIGGANYDTNGVYGVATKALDMPTNASGRYGGDANSKVETEKDVWTLSGGKSVIDATFNNTGGIVDITLSGFIATDQSTGLAWNAAIDKITVTNMSISGNSFSARRYQTTLNGTSVSLTGKSASHGSQGKFFCYDRTFIYP
jgi:hypothetical protein